MITGHGLLKSCPPAGLTVESNPDVGPVRRLATLAAATQGFGQTDAERLSVVAAEMATHLMRHASSGRMLVRKVEWGEMRGVELVATGGPRMDDAGHPRTNGYRTSGARAGGLEAIADLADLFDTYSVVGRGTVMMARLWGVGLPPTSDRRFLGGSMAEAIPGEVVSGDAWALEETDARLVALAVDGLGHGADAAAASAAAVEALHRHHREPVEDIVGHIHHALQGTRGAAIAVAEVDPGVGRLRFCGIGNIAARLIVPGGGQSLISHYGIAGYQVRRIQAFESAWADDALLVMHSDGLSTSWDFDAYPGLHLHHPQLVAATVMRDAPRANDDAMVLVVSCASEAVRSTVPEVG